MGKLVTKDSKRTKCSPKSPKICTIVESLLLDFPQIKRLAALSVLNCISIEHKGKDKKQNQVLEKAILIRKERITIISKEMENLIENLGFIQSTEKTIVSIVV